MTINPRTGLCALLGDPVSHSGSPAMHNAAFKFTGENVRYLAFQVTAGDFPAAVRGLAALGAVGANVTVPHKEQALALADEASTRAQRIGAANVLTFKGGRVVADNTDGAGFIKSLQQAGGRVDGRNVLVVGAGGAARAVIVACLEAGARRVLLLNRSLERGRRLVDTYRQLLPEGDRLSVQPLTEAADALKESHIIINATSLGLRADDPSPLADWSGAPDDAIAVDLIYAPHSTAFLDGARERGLPAIDGQGMLVWQAALSWQAWFGRTGPHQVMAEALQGWLSRR